MCTTYFSSSNQTSSLFLYLFADKVKIHKDFILLVKKFGPLNRRAVALLFSNNIVVLVHINQLQN